MIVRLIFVLVVGVLCYGINGQPMYADQPLHRRESLWVMDGTL